MMKCTAEPQSTRADRLFGSEGATILRSMEAAHDNEPGAINDASFDLWVERLFTYASRLKKEKDRISYIRTCISNAIRSHDLKTWLQENPDLHDLLDDDEQRTIPVEERRAYNRERAKAETELMCLRGEQPGLAFKSKLGEAEAARLIAFICSKLDIATPDGFQHYVAILRAASKPTIRHPEQYVRTCIRKAQGTRKARR